MCPSGAGRGGVMGSLHRSARAAGRVVDGALRIALSTLLLIGCVTVASAQEPPPLDVPPSGVLVPGDALRAGDWLLYPSLRTFSAYSDNLLQSPVSPDCDCGHLGLIQVWLRNGPMEFTALPSTVMPKAALTPQQAS